MTTFYGVVGAKSVAGHMCPQGAVGGLVHCYHKDYYSVVAGVGDTDRVYLGEVPSDAYLDADLSKIIFDDFGTSITMDITCDATVEPIKTAKGSNTITPLVDNLDVATAAGSSSLLASVGTTGKHKQLWEQLNLAQDPRCGIKLYGIFAGNPGTGNLSWKWLGS